ncbi:hypothetical protein, partial [Klebsiella pneumoniae]|uniref:hypothetical protein n=1 Tax=Klebsiella pneumoniae TaxID=573 RepID=UPI003EDFE6A9
MLAIKDDIKNEKQTGKDSEENLQKFTNELAEEYKDLLVNKRIKNKRIKIAEVSETGKQDFIEAMKPSYQKLKNHLKEYAISGV